ncbi:MAG: hypothetical protein EBY39_03065 [Flavobacteriia bacterium]|nr:hypothetical protein [Flavobacteriia bacterium]
MDFRPVLSPITIGHSFAASAPYDLSAQAEIRVNGSLIYTLLKNYATNLNRSIYFEVGEILRDYVEVEFDGTYTNITPPTATIDFEIFDAINAGGNSVYTSTDTFKIVKGYTYFQQGANVIYTTDQFATDARTIYVPENTAGRLPVFNTTNGQLQYTNYTSTQQTKTFAGQTVNIVRFCEPKYTPYKVTFVNKFGALEDTYFSLLRRDISTLSSESYKRHITDPIGEYNINDHSYATYNVKAKDTLTLNTPFVDDAYNDIFFQLLASQQIWIYENSAAIPIKPITKTLDRKTNLNDRLVQYTMEFEYAFDKINNIA